MEIPLNHIDLHHKTSQFKFSTNNNGKYMLWIWNQCKQKDFQRTRTNHNKGRLKFKCKHEIKKSKWCVHNVNSSNKIYYDGQRPYLKIILNELKIMWGVLFLIICVLDLV